MEDLKDTPKLKNIRMPDFYKFCGQVLKAYLNCEGKIPQLVNTISKNNPRRSRDSGSFLQLLVPNLSTIKAVTESVGLLKKFETLSPLIAYIIVGDLLLKKTTSQRLTNQSYAVTSVMSMKEEIEAEFSKHGGVNKCRERSFGTSPRWVFVNNLCATVEEVNNALLENGYYLSNLTEKTYDCFLETVKTLGPGQYLDDFHLPGLLALPPLAPISHSQLFAEKKILLQDKASCLPPLVSGVVPGMTVVDACAAPGNKTILLANLLKGRGRLIAIDRDEQRFGLLKTRLSDHGAKNVRCINNDFSNVPHEDMQGAQVVLVDPSCSNSGVDMHTNEKSVSVDRIRGLAWMQLKLLSHALSIPGVQTVVYSTCSVHYEENEGVVEEAMLKFGDRFELEDLGQHIKPWKHFGVEKSPYGNKVLRTDPKVDLCHGFFVAKFVAKPEAEESYDSTDKCHGEWNENGQWDSPECAEGANSCPDHGYIELTKTEKKKGKHKCDSPLDVASKNPRVNGVCFQNSESKKSKPLETTYAKYDSNEKQLGGGGSDWNENTKYKKSHENKLGGNLTDTCEDRKKVENRNTVLTDNSAREQIIDPHSENTKSKKNKKRKHLKDELSLNVVSNNINGENCETKSKKKKAKLQEIGSANGTDCTVDENGETKKEKKKRKKNLHENKFDTSKVEIDGSEIVETKKEKKQKKKNLPENTFDGSVVEIDEGETVKTKKEKKKRKKNLHQNAFDESEVEIVEIRKRKKNIEKYLPENLCDANKVITIEDEISETTEKKKKKKRNLQGNACDTNASIVTRDDIEGSQEKRKRKKDLQHEVEIIGGETKKDKKKRRKNL